MLVALATIYPIVLLRAHKLKNSAIMCAGVCLLGSGIIHTRRIVGLWPSFHWTHCALLCIETLIRAGSLHGTGLVFESQPSIPPHSYISQVMMECLRADVNALHDGVHMHGFSA